MDRTYRRIFAGTAAVALAVSSVGSALAQESAAPAESMAAGGGSYRIGMTNTIVGNGQNGIRSQQGTVVLQNAISANADWGLFHEGFGNMGFAANAFEANSDGTLNCIVGAYCPQLGGNLCDGSTVCP